MTRAPFIEEPCAVKVASTVLQASGGSDPFAEPNQQGGFLFSLLGLEADGSIIGSLIVRNLPTQAQPVKVRPL